MQLAVSGESGVAPRAVHRDTDKFGLEILEFGENFIEECHLVATDRTPVGRVKGEHYGLSLEFAETYKLIRRTAQSKIGGFCTRGKSFRLTTPRLLLLRYLVGGHIRFD